ncbi:hypothetical protein [Burkholderia anthina]|uniref:hypothetical protein n=1 Tax=Burkholderia anthina TaxID=179879 RepID=UPI0037BFEF23
MHPKAATLALAGCRVFVLGAMLSPRIAPAVRIGEPMLAYDSAIMGWRIARFATPALYKPADWLAVSDNEWVVLRDTLIAMFLERL